MVIPISQTNETTNYEPSRQSLLMFELPVCSSGNNEAATALAND